MATETPSESSFWERLGERLSGITEAISKLLLRLFGSSNERYIRKLGYLSPKKPTDSPQITAGSLLAQVNELEPKVQAMSDAELAGTTTRLREKLAGGASLDDLLPEAFAATREAGWRTKKMQIGRASCREGG